MIPPSLPIPLIAVPPPPVFKKATTTGTPTYSMPPMTTPISPLPPISSTASLLITPPDSPLTLTAASTAAKVLERADAFARSRMAKRNPPPASQPLQWLWQCHICRATYPLGATRRCLEDSHYFCAGYTTVAVRDTSPAALSARRKAWHGGVTKVTRAKTVSRIKRHKPCASEFDYQGWKDWNDWRRRETQFKSQERRRWTLEDPWTSGSSGSDDDENITRNSCKKKGKDCWNNCDYPSECRWKKLRGSATPSPASSLTNTTTAEALSAAAKAAKKQYMPTAPSQPSQPPPQSNAATTFEQILTASTSPLTSVSSSSRSSQNSTTSAPQQLVHPKLSIDTFWGSLVASVTARKSTNPYAKRLRSNSSPSSLNASRSSSADRLPSVAEVNESNVEDEANATNDTQMRDS